MGARCFNPLMRRQPPFHFYAFDLLALDGEDLRARPLVERKALLKRLVRQPMLFVDHVKARGVDRSVPHQFPITPFERSALAFGFGHRRFACGNLQANGIPC
jgi:hypothetical protein